MPGGTVCTYALPEGFFLSWLAMTEVECQPNAEQ